MKGLWDRLRRAPGTSFGRAAERAELDRIVADGPLDLPGPHLDMLCRANGLMAGDGYFRLFGLACLDATDLLGWNDFDTWKFAWNRDLSRFLCFGETAWGDQYAYDRESESGEVHFLDALAMDHEVIAGDFEEFMEKEFLRCAFEPYDEALVAARKSIGPLAWPLHLVCVPSPLIGGAESAKNVIAMDARAGMIVNGDLATQCARETSGRKAVSLETYMDGKGRARIRINWS